MKNKTYFISGIDTNIGKSYATGILAKELLKQGIKVITQKMIQTGNKGFSEDIDIHRQIMGISYTSEDKEFLTAPCIRTYPCSPHLAAKIDNQPIDLDKIHAATIELEKRYDIVLLEGAGGLMVPITEDFLTIDYICKQKYPLIFVTSGKLGSLNHTLLSLEAIKNRNIELYELVYNSYPQTDSIIESDSLLFLESYLKTNFPKAKMRIIEELQ